MKVAIIHDWLTGMRGGENVLEAIIDLYPDAELFTLLHVPGSVSPKISNLPIHTTWLQNVPGIDRRYRHFLPLMPKAIESFDLRGFDLVLSSSHCVAKGVRKPPGAVHVSYVHAPMRYVWDRFDDYFGPGRASPWVRLAAHAVRPYLQRWDRASGAESNIDLVIANSHFVASQIRANWGREARVIHPFADLRRFLKRPREPGNDYLMVGAFAPNKRVDVAIQAFNELKLPLKIVGSGQEEARLRAMAGPTIEFLGAVSNERIEELLSRCKAFVFPGLEDFGITLLEAMAAGAPIIAYRSGGACESVTNQTGIFFAPQTPEALADAVRKLEKGAEIRETECRARAGEFSRERFMTEFRKVVEEAIERKGQR